jgi:hypothetical protein
MSDTPPTVPVDLEILKSCALLTAGQVLAFKGPAHLRPARNPIDDVLRQYGGGEYLYRSSLSEAVLAMHGFAVIATEHPELCTLETPERRLIAEALQTHQVAQAQASDWLTQTHPELVKLACPAPNWTSLIEKLLDPIR